jgi:hypothetical protein
LARGRATWTHLAIVNDEQAIADALVEILDQP